MSIAPCNVAHVITGLDTGGAEMMLVKILEGGDRKQWRATVLSLRDRGTLGDSIEGLGVPVNALGLRGSLPGPGHLLRLVRQLRRVEPQLIQGWMYHGNLAATIGQTIARRGTPVIWNIRYTLNGRSQEKPLTAAIIRLSALLSGRVARIIYNSHTSARQHAAIGYSAAGSVVIPNGFDTDRFAPSASARLTTRQALGIPTDAVLIGRIGRYHSMKDYPGFLHAAALLVRERPHVRFVLAGLGVDDRNRELTDLVHALELGGKVHMLGEVRPINALMSSLDVFCSSSAFGESFPNVLGEAMASGVACVTTDVGDSGAIVSRAGHVVPPKDPAALAAACRTLIDLSIEGRGRLGAEGRARVVSEFSLPRIVERYESLYTEVLGGRVTT
jgi:glycosyltransferase involved in cell wall biosynthesis